MKYFYILSATSVGGVFLFLFSLFVNILKAKHEIHKLKKWCLINEWWLCFLALVCRL